MDLIYSIDSQHLIVHQSVLSYRKLLSTDFLGKVTILTDAQLRIQGNYFNRMLLGMFIPAENNAHEMLPSTLTDYQKTDVHKSLRLRTFCNFNRMGYGKTVETIAHLRAQGTQRILIVAPKAVLEQWKDHIAEWYPEMHKYTYIVRSVQGLAGVLATENGPCCVILNYEKLLQTTIATQLRSTRVWDMIVFDEAHYLKNRKSKRTMAAQLIPSLNRCVLTGTPVMSHLDDLWSILFTLDWKYSGQHYWPWVEKFCEVKDDFYGKKIVGPTRNTRDLEHLKQYIDLIAIRNPDLQLTQGKRIVHVPLTLPKEQRTFYNKIKKLVLDELPDNLTVANGAVKCVRLRQVLSCPQILDPKQKAGIKFEWIKNFVENTEEQVLILTQFSYTVGLLHEYLQNWDPAIYTGSLNANVRSIQLDRFKSKETQILIATTQSIGTGVDGLQSCCRLGIVVDADYSPEVNSQAEDRLNRMGQSELVCWYYLECKNSWDQHVLKINDCKNKSIKEMILSE